MRYPPDFNQSRVRHRASTMPSGGSHHNDHDNRSSDLNAIDRIGTQIDIARERH